ncbi:GspE/PulE family protein [Phormidium sp. CCY1219]|uniref:GspE/PulE family protein n=1 Tax=Phormidium sp. CCY1219 TaxID=2886104 RepID=UPI002D1E88BF|nr:ATPase, T2SS/T4P/T4SS family [Phormidium sp. CCY1219]MEB3826753.1 Flp pilus assembly complex ATPase component TadA [Phormidium sp. CCY1219]
MTNFASQRRALVVQNNFSPFGNKLIQSGYADREQVQRAHAESQKTGQPLTEVLEKITGKELTPELLRQYKKQQLFELKIIYGVEAVDPEIKEISVEQVGELLEKLIPIDTCRRHQIVPIERNETQPPSVSIGMVDPDNLAALDDLTRILRPSGVSIKRLVITQEDYQKLLGEYSDEKAKEQQAKTAEANKLDLSLSADAFETAEGESLDEAPEESEEMNLDAALRGANDAPIINTVNKILAKALSDGVSDIHVEPQEEFLRIRMRKDGVLHEFGKLPKKITPALTSRFKIISDLDIAERRNAQDGRIRRIFQGRTVDFRVNCLPSRYGEKLCLRILDNSSTQLGLDKLITNEETLATVREMASRPFGLILVTGPTGSGKSTSLYSVLAERNDPAVNISTAEDPIEYALPGITQCQVIRAKGLDFTNLLRAFMRQDPDIILVGETRDKETAKTAIEAALTGHLVLTTLHTNDAAGAIARLDEMGVEPFMVAGSLIGVLAQRLMRRVCSECRVAYTPTPEELARFGLAASRESEVTFYKANTIAPGDRKAAQDAGNLCPKCGGNGYKGRVGVYEVLKVTENLQTLISQGAPTERIKEAAVEEGMLTLLAYSINLVREGYTTFEEVERVTFTDSGLEAEMKAKRKSSLTCKTCGAGLQQEWMDCPYCLTPRFQD